MAETLAPPPGFEMLPPPPDGFSLVPPRPNSWDVARNAIIGGAASIPDSLLNTPNRLMNLDKAIRGSVMNALGMPERAPETTPDPDYVRRLLEHTGVIKAGVAPQGKGQRMLDLGLRGLTAGALTGGGGLANTVAGASTGALSAVAAGEAADRGAPPSVQIMAGALAPAVAARIARPITPSRDVQTLLDANIVPTPGQLFGKDSYLNRLEQAMESRPVIGAVPRGARNRAQGEFNRAELNFGVPAGQPPVREIGRQGLSEVRQRTDANFDPLLAGRNLSPDAALAANLLAATKNTTLPLNAAGTKKFSDILDTLVWQRMPTQNLGAGANYTIPAADFKSKIVGDLGREAQRFRSMSNSDDQAVGQALQEARNRANTWLQQNIGASPRDLAEADRAYTAFASARTAGERGLAQDMTFTPYQMLRSAQPGSQSYNLAAAAQNVLPNTLPNSGTADRALLAAVLSGGGGAGIGALAATPGLVGQAASVASNPWLWAPLTAGALAYTRPGSRYLGGGYSGLANISDALQSAPLSSLYGINAGAQ